MYARTICSALATVLFCMAACVSQAAVVINMAEQGADVVATMSGTLNLTDLITTESSSLPGYMDPTTGRLLLGTPGIGSNSFDYYRLITSPPSNGAFGTGGTTFTSLFSGDFLGIRSDIDNILLPAGYQSGATLSSTTTWSGKSLATLGVTPGDYVWSWGSGANADTITLSVAAPVPEPSTWVLAIAGASCAAWGVARRRRAAVRARGA